MSEFYTEKIEKSPGKKVAVTLFWKNLPYDLAETCEPFEDLVRIYRDDGSNEVVSEDTLSDIKDVQTSFKTENA